MHFEIRMNRMLARHFFSIHTVSLHDFRYLFFFLVSISKVDNRFHDACKKSWKIQCLEVIVAISRKKLSCMIFYKKNDRMNENPENWQCAISFSGCIGCELLWTYLVMVKIKSVVVIWLLTSLSIDFKISFFLRNSTFNQFRGFVCFDLFFSPPSYAMRRQSQWLSLSLE